MMVKKAAFIQKVTEIVNQFFESEFSTKPTSVTVILDKDILIIKLVGIFSQSERDLAMTREGDELLNKVYKSLFDRTVPILEKRLKPVVREGIKSSRMEMNPKDTECFCIFTFSGNIEEKLNLKKKRGNG